ncbi:VC0807 family protein [Marininema halotolerans]|uniref:Intracellular septation protein A n=1 Tax=Marininema halotolerans TaxID=1155944 RepID=A0A1I6QED8_9BACL|nr:VC0807 family protein [Marininema halotolerans]SFS50841.1 hypothetical protein SAMN05444972_103101 [Marininema halotolerans]
MQRSWIGMDILFYVLFPLIIWYMGREWVGDYVSMLLTTVPGIIYTTIRFLVTRQFNVTGMALMILMIVGSVIDLLSGSALQMMWNDVWYGLILAGLLLGSILIGKPVGYYFMLDISAYFGYQREWIKEMLHHKRAFSLLQLLTLLYGIKQGSSSLVKAWMIDHFGVDGFNQILLVMKGWGWMFSLLISYIIYRLFRLIASLAAEKQPLTSKY